MSGVIFTMEDWTPDWFDKIYLDNYNRLKSCVYRLLGDSMLADELVQETFLILLNKQQTLRKSRHPNIEGWLVLTARNLVKNELAKANRRNEFPLIDETVALTTDQHGSLEDALPDSLSPDERKILVWFYEEQLSVQEVACRLNIPESTVRVKLFRVRQKYKKFLENVKEHETKTVPEYIER